MYKVGNIRTEKRVQTNKYAYLRVKWAIYILKNTYERGNMCLTYRVSQEELPDFGRVFLMLKYTDITQNTYVQSWTVTEIMARERCGLLAGPRTVPVSWQSYPCPPLSMESYNSSSAHATLISEWRSALLRHSWAVICHVYCLEP